MPAGLQLYQVVSQTPIVVQDGALAISYSPGQLFNASPKLPSIVQLLSIGSIVESTGVNAQGQVLQNITLVTDAELAELYIKANGTRAFTGHQSMGAHYLTALLDPVNPQDAATKNYVDTHAGLAGSLATTGAPVVINTSAPPSVGQVLIATSPTAASWQSISDNDSAFIMSNGSVPFSGNQSMGGHTLTAIGSLVLSGSTSGTITIQAPAIAGTQTYTLPVSTGTSGYFLQTDGAGVLSWQPVTDDDSAFIRHDGTVPFTGNQSLGGFNLTNIGTANALTLTLRGSTSGTTSFIAGATPTTTTYTWPAAPTAGNFLQTDGLGNLSWAAAGGGSTYAIAPTGGTATSTGANSFAGGQSAGIDTNSTASVVFGDSSTITHTGGGTGTNDGCVIVGYNSTITSAEPASSNGCVIIGPSSTVASGSSHALIINTGSSLAGLAVPSGNADNTLIGRGHTVGAGNSDNWLLGRFSTVDAGVSDAWSIGRNNTIHGQSVFAFGRSITAGTTNADSNIVVIGQSASAVASLTVAIGGSASAASAGAVAIGNGAQVSAAAGFSVAIGQSATALAPFGDCVTIGTNASCANQTFASDMVAIGTGAYAGSFGSTIIGSSASGPNEPAENVTVVGAFSTAQGQFTCVFGESATGGTNCIAIGEICSNQNATNSISIGNPVTFSTGGSSNDHIVIGNGAHSSEALQGHNSQYNIGIGTGVAYIDFTADCNHNIWIGHRVTQTGNNALDESANNTLIGHDMRFVVGLNSWIHQVQNTVSIGANQVYTVNPNQVVAIGATSTSSAVGGVAVGYGASVTGTNGVALGLSSTAGATEFSVLNGDYNFKVGTVTGVQFGASNTVKMGWFGATPIVQPSVTGSRGGNAALASLLTELALLGLIVDNTTA